MPARNEAAYVAERLDDHTSTLDLAADNLRRIAEQLLGPDESIEGSPELAGHLEQLGDRLLRAARALNRNGAGASEHRPWHRRRSGRQAHFLGGSSAVTSMAHFSHSSRTSSSRVPSARTTQPVCSCP
ncbi:hypothetical protein ACFVFQ_06205 [Streptomyces sp. NPDC057743]|uniref:hypothetical protein n=1 Tax=Streptomyces sp. NPDC057743 TaxID=3346236 RepID=UPI0036CA33F5